VERAGHAILLDGRAGGQPARVDGEGKVRGVGGAEERGRARRAADQELEELDAVADFESDDDDEEDDEPLPDDEDVASELELDDEDDDEEDDDEDELSPAFDSRFGPRLSFL
jgi:hypothetical protein